MGSDPRYYAERAELRSLARYHARQKGCKMTEKDGPFVDAPSGLFSEGEQVIDYAEYFSEIEKVIYNTPTTIVILKTGEKGIAKLQEGDIWNPELGFWVAYAKALRGRRGEAVNIAQVVIKNTLAEFAQRKRNTDTMVALSGRGEYVIPSSQARQFKCKYTINGKLMGQSYNPNENTSVLNFKCYGTPEQALNEVDK